MNEFDPVTGAEALFVASLDWEVMESPESDTIETTTDSLLSALVFADAPAETVIEDNNSDATAEETDQPLEGDLGEAPSADQADGAGNDLASDMVSDNAEPAEGEAPLTEDAAQNDDLPPLDETVWWIDTGYIELGDWLIDFWLIDGAHQGDDLPTDTTTDGEDFGWGEIDGNWIHGCQTDGVIYPEPEIAGPCAEAPVVTVCEFFYLDTILA